MMNWKRLSALLLCLLLFSGLMPASASSQELEISIDAFSAIQNMGEPSCIGALPIVFQPKTAYFSVPETTPLFGGGGGGGSPEEILVESITLNVNEMAITKAYTLTATVLPVNATDKSLSWSSSNLAIASVSNGVVTPGSSDGTCTITVTANDGSGAKTECLITVKRFRYSVSDEKVTITGYYGNEKSSMIIPTILDGYPVVEIGFYAFGERTDLSGNLVIPDSIKSIGNQAFQNCSGFTGSLVIPDGITRLGDSVFERCSGFTGNLVIPSSVTSIEEEAFIYCSGFTGSLVIADSVASIGENAFFGCRGSPAV